MAERIEADLWRLDIPLVRSPLKNLNSYLITGERNLLIDTGFRQAPCREAMVRQLAEIGVDLSRTDIFLTHLHSDHAGLAPELIRPSCKIYISAIDLPGLEGAMTPERWRKLYQEYERNGFSPEEIGRLWHGNPAQNAGAEQWDPSWYTPLEGGDQLTYGGHRLQCVLTPGHTPGHLCLYEPESRWLFCGDHVLFHITPNICRWSGVSDSLDDYLRSLEQVKSLPVERLLPAHRAETGDLVTRAEELRVHHLRRLEDALDIVRRRPGSTAYDIAGEMRWSIRCRDWTDFPVTQKFFAVGEALSHLDYLEVRGLVERRQQKEHDVYFAGDGGGILSE